MKYEEFNEDYGCNEFANEFEETSGRYAALQSLLLGEDLDEDEIKSIREFDIIKKFLDAPMGDKCESSLKKLFALSIIIAHEKGILPFELPDSPVAIASIIDEGLTRLKVAYKTGKGEFDVVEAADALIYSLSVRIITVLDKVIDKGLPVLLDKLCDVIIKTYPPFKTIVPIIKTAEKNITENTKLLIHKGINFAAKAAKSVVRKVVSIKKKVTAKIKELLNA